MHGAVRHAERKVGRVKSCIIRWIVAVAPGTLEVTDADVVLVDIQGSGEVPTQWVHALGVTPHLQHGAVKVGYRGSRAD